ncbi:ABC transporter substrate-binding protein [Paracoccus sanguinis]|uniref:ABC transporter substrate-binding protein n=1 Tax=Paracoccus sanguinis TaxID=1545044 RepID=UPI00051F9FCC|nr:ABC transporter substrate-binding protein [Paracoccus sanguinis]KGJ19732.1 polyamine ABC transporter substrate-binding protein [Paracoccus sanguinis]
MQRTTSLIALVAAGFTLYAAPGLAAGTIHYGVAAPDLSTMDPYRATATPDKPLTGWLYNGLVRFPPGSDDISKLEPDLAESWENSEDGLVWTFHLRKGVKFHKGYGELTADDVVFSLQRAGNADTSAFSSDYAAIEKVEAVAPLTVKITLKNPVPSLLGLVANYHGGNILSRKAVEELGEGFKSNPVGTGPFMFDSYTAQDNVTFVANPDYFRGAPKIDKVVVRYIPSDSARDLAFQSGELEIMYGRQDEEWIKSTRGVEHAVVDVMRPAELQQLHLNESSPPLDNLAVRQAVAMAVNRDEYPLLVGETLARPATSVIPEGNLGWDGSHILYGTGDVEGAKAKLAEAGFPDGVTLKMVQTSLPSMLSVAQLLQSQLAKANIKVELDVVDHQTFHANIRKDLSQLVYYSAARFPVADVFLTQFFYGPSTVTTPKAVVNFSHCKVADADIEAARAERDPQKQLQLWSDAQKKIIDEVCAVPLFQQLITYAHRDTVNYGYTLEAAMHLGPIITEQTTVTGN